MRVVETTKHDQYHPPGEKTIHHTCTRLQKETTSLGSETSLPGSHISSHGLESSNHGCLPSFRLDLEVMDYLHMFANV